MPRLHGAALQQKARALAFDALQVAPPTSRGDTVASLTRKLHAELRRARTTRHKKTRARTIERAAVLAGRLTHNAKDLAREAREARTLVRRAARLLEVWP